MYLNNIPKECESDKIFIVSARRRRKHEHEWNRIFLTKKHIECTDKRVAEKAELTDKNKE